MFVRFGILGNAAVIAGGKWNLLGHFNLLRTRVFPLRWPEMGILLRLEGDHREIGRHTLRVDFVNETGERLTGADALEFQLNEPSVPGFPIDFVIGIKVANLDIPGPGNYDFVVRVDDTYLDSIPLYVRALEEPPQN